MRRDLKIVTGNLVGVSDFRVVAHIKQGFVPSLDTITYKTRVKRVLATLHAGRLGAYEYELARILSDAVERVGSIHSVSIAVLEPEDKVILAVTFDGAWESYVRVIWEKVSRLLDLIFCNTEGYVLGYESSYEKWGAWVRQAQTEASFLYATPGLTVDDIRYLRMNEKVYRRKAGDPADQRVTRIRIPTTEEIAEQEIFGKRYKKVGLDPTNAGFGEPLSLEDAGRPPFRHAVRSLVGLYRLADVYPPNTADGVILHRAAHELLPEFVRMVLHEGTTYEKGIDRACQRFPEAMSWIRTLPCEPPVRKELPLKFPDEPPLTDPSNVQGGVLSPYPDVDHGCLLLLQFASPAALAAFLKNLRVTSAADSLKLGEIAINIAFTVEGLRVAGLSDDEVGWLPEEFVQGMDRRAGLLGDVRANHPRRWRLPVRNWDRGIEAPDVAEDDPAPRIDLSAVHAVAQVRLRAAGPGARSRDSAAASREQLMAAMRILVDADPGVMPLSLQWMQRWRNAAGEVEEHFGFLDGNAQPVLRKVEAGKVFANNQIHLGEILCGYPNLADKTNPYGRLPVGIRSLLHDGSFLVVRKLRQDIEALEQALGEGVRQATEMGQTLTREDFMARMVGRWPGGHPMAGQPLANVPGADPLSNDFHFDNDPQGSRCPFHAHIRRAHPRITSPRPGSRPARIVRGGMSYGPHHDRNTTDPGALRTSLDQERGLIFMAYNASLGEQFEVIQSWLADGNSSGSYSGQSDPLLGLAASGQPRYFRFEHEGQTVRMLLDGTDRLHDEPRPFVRLEWGIYLFAPSKAALAALGELADKQIRKQAVLWSADAGAKEIARLRDVETSRGALAAADAWKSALEDPDAAANFSTASIWAAIRERHGGVLRTPYGILVADADMVEQILADPNRYLTITGYLPRMRRSFGILYLGLDADQEDCAYERESEACNRAILAIDDQAAFEQARQSTLDALNKRVEEAIDYATQDHESSWDLTIDARELVDPLLADFCESWFGLNEEGKHFQRAGYRWDWKMGEPPPYPGHFLSPSRYIFQPHPGPEVELIGAAHGVAMRCAMLDFLNRFGATIRAPVTRTVLDSPPGDSDVTFAARTLVGAMMGFVPTVDGNLRRILNEWLREGTLWFLRARYAGTPAADFADAWKRLSSAFIPAMQLRAVPETIWRTATVSHTLGTRPHHVAVNPGDVVIAGSISATQQSLEQHKPNLSPAFGGDRRAAGHPTHACPGANAAIAVMLGFFSALVESPLRLRVGPGPLTLGLDGRLPKSPALRERFVVSFRDARAFEREAVAPSLKKAVTIPLVTIGDSWLINIDTSPPNQWNSLAASLRRKHGYDTTEFAGPGKLLAEMAGSDLDDVIKYLTSPDVPPKAMLIGGGGNDLVRKPPRLREMLNQSPQIGSELIDQKVDQFIKVELKGFYKAILDALIAVTPIPILLHGYDHPIPDKRPLVLGGVTWGGPWLEPIFSERNIAVPPTPPPPRPQAAATDVMRRLIDRLNAMLSELADDYRKRGNPVYHVSLCGTLESDRRYAADYRQLWANELHATSDGFDLLAALIAKKLTDLKVG